jgi:hypothetical protein
MKHLKLETHAAYLVKEENTFPPLGLNEDAFQPSFNVYGRDAEVSTGDGIEWSFA